MAKPNKSKSKSKSKSRFKWLDFVRVREISEIEELRNQRLIKVTEDSMPHLKKIRRYVGVVFGLSQVDGEKVVWMIWEDGCESPFPEGLLEPAWKKE